jgi:hypothetical protein
LRRGEPSRESSDALAAASGNTVVLGGNDVTVPLPKAPRKMRNTKGQYK